MKHNIRIGTLVHCGDHYAPDHIKQILHHGFESFQIFFWKSMAGVSLPKIAEDLKAVLDDQDVVISSLGVFGNPMGNSADNQSILQGWKDAIDYAHLFNTDIVSGFTGRINGTPIPDSIPQFKEMFGELAKRAEDKGVRLAFENCALGGSWNTGDMNMAHSPAAWELMFDAIPADNLGLEWEPCHQMLLGIDPLPQLKKWMPKIFHVHGKDASIYKDVLETYGTQSPHPWAEHRTPGFGDSNWTDIISELRRSGYSSTIDIEGLHDPIYSGELEMTGQVHALNYLKQCRGGDYVPNPN